MCTKRWRPKRWRPQLQDEDVLLITRIGEEGLTPHRCGVSLSILRLYVTHPRLILVAAGFVWNFHCYVCVAIVSIYLWNDQECLACGKFKRNCSFGICLMDLSESVLVSF